MPAEDTLEQLSATAPFDLVSMPDSDSQALRDQLASYGLSAGLVTPGEVLQLPAEEWEALCRETLDLVTGLLLLRRVLIVLMQSTGTEAIALPFMELAKAALLPLRVKHETGLLEGVLQVALPGEGLVTVSSSYAEPPAGWDSEGSTEVERLRAAAAKVLEALELGAGLEAAERELRAACRR